MARKGAPGIISVGNRHEWPRECWGSRDWEDEERLQARLAVGQELGNSPVVPPPGPVSSFSPLSKPREREVRGARSRAVDRLIQKLGPR